MDLIQYPFVLESGSPPRAFVDRAFVDRNRVREILHLWLERLHTGPPRKSLVLIGLSGAGQISINDPMVQVRMARERPLPAILASQLNLAFSSLNRFSRATHHAVQRLTTSAGSVIAPMPVTENIPARSPCNLEQTLYGNGDLTLLCGQIPPTTATQDTTSIDEMGSVADPNLTALTNSILLWQWVTAC